MKTLLIRGILATTGLVACSDYNFSKDGVERGSAEDSAVTTPPGQVQVSPAEHLFGELLPGQQDTVEITIANIGEGVLTVQDLAYAATDGDLQLQLPEGRPLPWTLSPGASAAAVVTYIPSVPGEDVGTLQVASDDPAAPLVEAIQRGTLAAPPPTQCTILDDTVAYETTSSGDHVVDHHGDTDLYWYEPSGYHGLLGTTDAAADFAGMRAHVTSNAAPTTISWPVRFDTDSTLSTFAYATFTYILCDFWVPPEDDPAAYALSIGAVDDGVQIILNAEILGYLKLTESGAWTLPQIVPGELNHLLVTLVDDSASDRYMNDLWLTRDGVPID